MAQPLAAAGVKVIGELSYDTDTEKFLEKINAGKNSKARRKLSRWIQRHQVQFPPRDLSDAPEPPPPPPMEFWENTPSAQSDFEPTLINPPSPPSTSPTPPVYDYELSADELREDYTQLRVMPTQVPAAETS